MIAATLARRCVTICVPPSAQAELLACLELALLWVNRQASIEDVTSARIRAFQSVAAVEQMTEAAIVNARAHMPPSKVTPLDPHADHVVTRYARLAAHFTVSAVCHCLDGVEKPPALLEVPGDVEGARAYQATGLGSARHPAFRQAAWDQADWESSRLASGEHDGSGANRDVRTALAVQVFHEYLGGRWRMHADTQRIALRDFVAWALSGRRAMQSDS